MSHILDDILMHYGTPRHSGRYPYGSGDNPYQRTPDFASRVQELRNKGMKDTDICTEVGVKSTTELRAKYTAAINQRRSADVTVAESMLGDGYSKAEIGRRLGLPESTVRSLLDRNSKARMNKASVTADSLRNQVETIGMLDVTEGVERSLGISKDKMNVAIEMLKQEGYVTYNCRVPQATNPGKYTTTKVLCPKGTQYKDVYENDFGNIHPIKELRIRSDSEGEDFVTPAFVYPKSMDSKRLMIRYAEEGGLQKDGVIELRRNVPDLSLGESRYAQARILVDDTHYLKGMTMYAEDMPDGVDVIFNTNKPLGTPLTKVLKPIKNDPDNPFGALLKEKGGQSYYEDENGEKQLSLINKCRDEGDWKDWSDSVPTQFLSKQPKSLIEKQINLTIADKQAEFEEICSLTNPTVKKQLLDSFADDCDSTAVHLKTVALPRQKYQVILPVNSLGEQEVFAPNYDNGERLALIRFPHAGTFEIPILKVNNKNQESIDVLGLTATDTVGINSKVAERLSGADFDGDTVMVIPCNSSNSKIKIVSTKPLSGLEGFDPKMKYGADEVVVDEHGVKHAYKNGSEFKIMTNTQNEMGRISNLITDMTIKGAQPDEIARAVRHSMVVIDAEKHHLNYKQSEDDNAIASLKKSYQGYTGSDGKFHTGASTLLSRAGSPVDIPKRRGTGYINQKGKSWYNPDLPEGAMIYNEANEEYRVYKTLKDPRTGKVIIDPTTGKPAKVDTGKIKQRTESVSRMAITSDANDLSTGNPVETLYANFANKMKTMANDARKEKVYTGNLKYNARANEIYKAEADSLKAKVNLAQMNAPRERTAQRIANGKVEAQKRANPDMTKKEIRKCGQMALVSARARFGAKRVPVEITDREWEAIQAGAISENTLSTILRFADTDELRQRATPRSSTILSSAKQAKIKAMALSGYSTSDIAKAVGCSSTSVIKYIKGKEQSNG